MVSGVTRAEAESISGELAVLAEPHRLLVLRHLRRGARSAGFLASALGISPSLASHHLGVLVDAGLVSRQAKGHFVCYSADHERVRALHRRLGRLAGLTGAVAEVARGRADDPC